MIFFLFMPKTSDHILKIGGLMKMQQFGMK
jgi:hypothetical protein